MGIFGDREGNVLLDLGAQLAGRQKEDQNKERTTFEQLFQGFRKCCANIGEMRLEPAVARDGNC